MSEPNVRSNIGNALKGKRGKWIIQGHFGSTWQNGQYVRTREMDKVKEAFSDLLTRLQTDYIDLGMIHFVDEEAEFHRNMYGKRSLMKPPLRRKRITQVSWRKLRITHIRDSVRTAVTVRRVRPALISQW